MGYDRGAREASEARRIAQVSLCVSDTTSNTSILDDSLISLGGILKGRENVGVGTALDTVDKRRDLGEERVVVGVGVTLLVVIPRTTDVEGRRLVRVDKSVRQYRSGESTSPHVESISPDFELASVGVALKSDSVGERADSAILVFPSCQRHTNARPLQLTKQPMSNGGYAGPRESCSHRWESWKAFQDPRTTRSTWHCRQLGPYRNSHNSVDINITAKVARQVTKVGTLLNDGSHVDGLVPPCGLGNRLVRARL